MSISSMGVVEAMAIGAEAGARAEADFGFGAGVCAEAGAGMVWAKGGSMRCWIAIGFSSPSSWSSARTNVAWDTSFRLVAAAAAVEERGSLLRGMAPLRINGKRVDNRLPDVTDQSPGPGKTRLGSVALRIRSQSRCRDLLGYSQVRKRRVETSKVRPPAEIDSPN